MRIALFLMLLAWAGTAAWNSIKPLPPGTHQVSLLTRLADSQLDVLDDSSAHGSILARELALIDAADQLIVLDQTPLLRETAQHLLLRKRRRPDLKIVVLADPEPEMYGGTPAHYLDSLERAGVIVARTRLARLRDPLAWYSALWRLGVGGWSDPYRETEPRAGLLAALRRSNAKADHRQLLVADDGPGGWVCVLPATAGGGVAMAVTGGLARDAAASELKIAAWSTQDDRLPGAPPPAALAVGSIDARLLTEGAIRAALVEAFAAAADGDEILLSTPALSDQPVLHAALQAAARGVRLRVMLKPGVAPNHAVAEQIRRARGLAEVRWLAAGAAGSSLAIVRHRRELTVDIGAADLTRLSLGDLNLSAAVELRLEGGAPAARRFNAAFEEQWSRATPETAPSDADATGYWRYRILQAAGLASY